MTDLTEQMHKGELPEGWYWVKDDDGQIKLAEYSVYCIDRETNETEYDWSCLYEIEQVLAPVPSYEEWQALKASYEMLNDANLKQATWMVDMEKENAQLKELLKECKTPLEVYNEMFGNKEELLTKIDEALK